MTWEMDLVRADPAAMLATAAEQPHDAGFVPFVRRAQAAGIPIEIVSDGFGFFIRPALERARRAGADRRHRPDDVAGRPPDDRLPERPSALLHLRDVQARPGPGPSRGGPAGRVHRRRRERPLRGRLQRSRVRQAVARATLPGSGLAVHALDALRGDRRLAGRDPRRLRRRPDDAASRCPTARRRPAGSSAAPRPGARAWRIHPRTPGPAPDVAGRTVRVPRDANGSRGAHRASGPEDTTMRRHGWLGILVLVVGACGTPAAPSTAPSASAPASAAVVVPSRERRAPRRT